MLNKKVKYKVVKLQALSGSQATFYTILPEGLQTTLFENFLLEHRGHYLDEVKDIVRRLKSMGERVGAREQYFKLREGGPGDLVCALYDLPAKSLRLYCIRYGKCCVIIGGGGPKPKTIRALQESKKLTEENDWMRQVSKDVLEKIEAKDISWSEDGFELIGNLNFNHEEE